MLDHWVKNTLNGVNKQFYSSIGLMLLILMGANSQAQDLEISRVPLFLTTPVNPNVLIVLDNSNSMDEKPDGTLGKTGVPNLSDLGGSAHPDSKSEIARRVMKSVVNDYQGRLNLGLMAYQQENNIAAAHVHNTLVDLAYSVVPNDPNFIYDANFQGARESNTKRIELVNPTDPTSFLYANVNLPFYSNVNQGTSFCYSPTAQAFNNGETMPLGPWDNYRCFSSKIGGSNTLPIWQDSADEAAQGYANYLFTVSLFPTDSDIAQGIMDFGRYVFWDHAGPTWYANSSPGRGYLHVPIADVDVAQKDKLDKKLATSQFVDNQPTGADFPLQNAGLTPLQGSLKSAKDYFTKNATPSEGYPQPVCDALPESCDKNYVILVTDGMPSVDDEGSEPASPEEAITQVEKAAAELQAAGVKTYVIGFALPFGVDDSQLDRIASEGGTGLAYDASDEASLQAAINAILYDIFEQTASAAPLSFSAKFLNPESSDPNANATKTYAYQTQFTSIDWTGTVKAYAFDSDGNRKPNPEWTVTDAGQIPIADNRTILTSTRDLCSGVCDPTTAAAFRWDEITDDDKALFNNDETVLNYVRGDQSLEGTVFRERKHLMGDIIQSESLYVGEPFYHYPDILESKPYSDFVATYKDRDPMLYVGANDGMLHAFDGRTGVERFSYVPHRLLSKLPNLASKTYTHDFYVDGSPTVVDAFFDDDWQTVLVSGLNAGGQAIFALNITDPTHFTENEAANVVLWEFSDHNDPDMGYSYSQPNVVKMANGEWSVVFGNGYNNTEDDEFCGHNTPTECKSSTGNAVLYILDVETGDVLAKLDTLTGKAEDPLGLDRPNGLASVAPVDTNNDRVIDVIYAGDLFGHLWKFDVSSVNPNQWHIAFGSAVSPEPLFTAVANDGSPQSIMVRPEIGRHENGEGVLVYFGTGKYLERSDNTQLNQATQTLYGLWDNDTTIANRSQLLQQSIIKEGSSNGKDYRLLSQNALSGIDWSSKRGWYVDLYNSDSGNTENYGERLVTSPFLRDGRIVFTSLIPTDDICEPGGQGWVMELDAQTGGRANGIIFDLNSDGRFNNEDYVEIDNNGSPDYVTVTGLKLGVGLPTAPAILSSKDGDIVLVTGSDGNIEAVGRSTKYTSGRQSWRQVY